MRLTPAVEAAMWARAGVSRIIDIGGFPFPSYDAFEAAVKGGDVQLGIEYAAARSFVSVTKSPAAAFLIIGLSWVTPLLALLSVILPFFTGNWWALAGAPSAFIGQFLANPYHPSRRWAKLGVILATVHVAFARPFLLGISWISFCFAVSAITLWVVNRLAWTWAHVAVLHSQALAALLFKTNNLHIRDRQGNFYDAKPAE